MKVDFPSLSVNYTSIDFVLFLIFADNTLTSLLVFLHPLMTEKSKLSSGIWQFSPIFPGYILKDFLVFLGPGSKGK